MAIRRFGSSVRGGPVGRREKRIPNSCIDFSDIAESTDEELRRAKRVGSPGNSDAKLLIAIRIRSSLLAKIQRAAKEEGKPYQTYIHEILEKRMKRIP